MQEIGKKMKKQYKQLVTETQGYALVGEGGVVKASEACMELEKHDLKTSAVGFIRDARVLLMNDRSSVLSTESLSFIQRSFCVLGFKHDFDFRRLPIFDPINDGERMVNNGNSLNLINAISKRMKGFGVSKDVNPIGDQARRYVHPFSGDDSAPTAAVH
jgi:hypothetical protein